MSTTPTSPTPSTASSPTAPGGRIDPRGPRFSAGITAVLVAVDLFLAASSGGQGAAWTAALWLTGYIVAAFAWGAFAGVRRHPYGWLFKTLVRPRLAPPTELEAPEPPTFAQLVGFIITGVGLVLGLFGLQWGLVVALGLAFIAAFLNAAFAFCLGCELYLLIQRVRRGPAPAA